MDKKNWFYSVCRLKFPPHSEEFLQKPKSSYTTVLTLCRPIKLMPGISNDSAIDLPFVLIQKSSLLDKEVWKGAMAFENQYSVSGNLNAVSDNACW